MMNLFLVGSDFSILCLQISQLSIQLHTLASRSIGNPLFQIGNGSTITSLLFMHIVGANTSNGVRLIAVHINQSLKAILFAAVKQPVNRTFLINLAMVRIEITQEIIPNYILRLTFTAEGIRNEFQVFIQRVCTVNSFHKLHEQTNNIILKVFIIANRDNVILIRSKRSILACIPFAACIGKPVHIQRITTKHTAKCIGNERANISAKVSLTNSDILVLNFRCQFVL